MIILYDDAFSPHARKVRLALHEKGIRFATVRALHGDCSRLEFQAVSPRAEVPAIRDGGFSLYDSALICQYLEEVHPHPAIYPKTPRLRARCRLIEHFADTELDAALYALTVVQLGRGESHAAMRAAVALDLTRSYGQLEEWLTGGPYLCGACSVADLAVLPHLLIAGLLGFSPDERRHPSLLRWLQRMQLRPSVVRDNSHVFSQLQRLQEERRPLFDAYHVEWRGARLEWILRNSLTDWLNREVAEGRAVIPSRPEQLGLPPSATSLRGDPAASPNPR
jgi:glutathione S-transferase